MMGNPQLALLGAIPAVLAMVYVDVLDAKRPEPRQTLRRVAIAGAISALPVVLLGELLRQLAPESLALHRGTTNYAAAFYMSFVIASIPEEAAKMGAFWLFAWRRPEFDERMDGIVYGARAGLGFALVENVVYLLIIPESFSEYLSVFLGRAILAVPGHATWGGITGYFAARRRFDDRGPGFLGGYAIAVVLHGTYDVLLFSAPIAMMRGHTWVGLGVAGVPIVAYVVPTVIIVGGAMWLRQLADIAIEDDDRAERAQRRAERRARRFVFLPQ